MWGWYCNTLADLQPIDRLIVNGDAIDGKGERQGGPINFSPTATYR